MGLVVECSPGASGRIRGLLAGVPHHRKFLALVILHSGKYGEHFTTSPILYLLNLVYLMYAGANHSGASGRIRGLLAGVPHHRKFLALVILHSGKYGEHFTTSPIL